MVEVMARARQRAGITWTALLATLLAAAACRGTATITPAGEATDAGGEAAEGPGEVGEQDASATGEGEGAAADDAGEDAAPVERFASADGLVSAPRPAGEGWECLEQQAEPPSPPATLIKCRQDDRDHFFFLMVKDSEVPASERRDVDRLVDEALPRTYGELFARFEITRSAKVERHGIRGRELWIEAEHARMGKIRKRVRIFVNGPHILEISAEGRPEVFDAMGPVIDAWFAGARLANLP